ncbi:MAG: hypothetical protein NTW56_12070 [Alphaproteobacteria bacterium]|nr:hypothetical protein [Alphaproteobacteria bacterium]
MRERFTSILRTCVQEAIREEVNRRLIGALQPPPAGSAHIAVSEPSNEAQPTGNLPARDVDTTDDELEGFRIIRSIGRKAIAANRIVMRDAQSYCAILADDNNRRPIARLYFSETRLRIGVFNADKIEERIDLKSIDDLYEHADKILSAVEQYAQK